MIPPEATHPAFANAKLLRRTAYPVAVAVLGLILFRGSRERDDANAIPVRLIVVNSAEDAQAIEARLKAGADFAVLAREASVDRHQPTGAPRENRSRCAAGELRDGLRAVQPGQISSIVNCRPPTRFCSIDGSTARNWGRPTAHSSRDQERRNHKAGPAGRRTG